MSLVHARETGDVTIMKPYEARLRVSVAFVGDGRAKQSFKDECDVNNIMKRYARDGLLDHVKAFGGDYADVAGVGTFHENCEAVLRARGMFDSLPAAIRSKFRNDPGEFLAFANDEENAEEMRELGLLPPERPEEPAVEPKAPKKAAKEPPLPIEPEEGD